LATLFISHSSANDTMVTALECWLRDHSFIDIFVDHHAIMGGDSWRQALQAAAGTCRVILCLVTENWLDSAECLAEFDAGFYMGKRILPLFLLGAQDGLDRDAQKRLARVQAQYQGLDLSPCLSPRGLDLGAHPDISERLILSLREAGALSRVGLDPEAFAVNRSVRPMPFPGLESFGDDDADAALFYGRSREIAQALEEIRAMRANGKRKPFVIFGASGAGKSSLLKAGIVPRLRRETPAWLTPRVFRPGADPLLNFSEALSRTLAEFGRNEAQGAIRDRLAATWSKAEREDRESSKGRARDLTVAGSAALLAALEAEGANLRQAAGRAHASILVGIDQAEELVRTDNESSEALADYLRATLLPEASWWQLAFTIRTDSYPELQNHRQFRDLEAHGFDLRAMPVFRFDSVVEAPAQRYGVVVEAALVDALMEHAPKDDTLPLLAFALQHLWRQYGASGTLTRDNYDKAGGLRGLIEYAAERALHGLGSRSDTPLPAPEPSRDKLGASTFVPTLADINDQGVEIRRIAPWTNFNEEQRQLLICFDEWRLVVRKGEADGGTVEVAHEALFRKWPRLAGWLEPERARLETLRSVQVDARNWVRNGRHPSFLNHRDARFADAEGLLGRPEYRQRMEPAEKEYVVACGAAERAARRQRRAVFGAIALLALAVIGGLTYRLNEDEVRKEWNWIFKQKPYKEKNFRPFVLSPEAEGRLQIGQRFRECGEDCPEMIVIPPGSFMMGSPKGEQDLYHNEERHAAEIKYRFAVAKYDVTLAEWNACVHVRWCPQLRNSDFHGTQRQKRQRQDDPFVPGREVLVNVSWNDAQAYVRWLSQMTDKGYRLLTETEWEYAARAGNLPGRVVRG
jgi:Sulfatase-modifying factor enzyme 1/TIR domain